MEREGKLEDKLRSAIQDLHTEIVNQRLAGTSANQVQRQMDAFMIDWSARLIEARAEQLKDAQARTEKHHQGIGEGVTLVDERERGPHVREDMGPAETQIANQIAKLRDGMFKAVLDIQKNRWPDLTPFVALQNKPLFEVDVSPERIKRMQRYFAEKSRDSQPSPENDNDPY